MGLDMYLKGKRYLSQFDDEDAARAKQIMNLFPDLNGVRVAIHEVTVDVGYWRKANAIHDWFVREVQEGEDDCGSYYVSRAQLTELRALCQRVLDFKHLGNELLPNVQGFFFGSQEYDEYYYQNLEHTIAVIDCALALPAKWDIQYQSSW
jgi:hypothetical protein